MFVGLEMGFNTVAILEIDGNTICRLFFLPEDKNKTQLSLLRRAREVADDVS